MLPRTYNYFIFATLKTIRKVCNNKINFSVHPRFLAAHAHRINYTMDKVYLRNEPDSQELHISFRYANDELKIDRDFNFCRKVDEKIETALTRIRGNIEKELNKKLKKGKKKTAAQVQEPITEVIPNGEVSGLLFCNTVCKIL